MIIIVSNSHLTGSLPAQPKLRFVGEDKGCPYLRGWGRSTLRLKTDRQDVTYISSRVPLTFRPRRVDTGGNSGDAFGNVEYDLLPTAVTWRVSGRRGDCTVDGEAIVNIPLRVDAPLDPTLPAYGYMNVVGEPNGDFHSIKVSAVDERALETVTCPGSPPRVSRVPLGVQWLLQVLHQTNTHESGAIVYKGRQTFDPERLEDNLPRGALDGLREMMRGMPEANEALQRLQDRSGAGRHVYTFEWELKP